MDPSTSSLVVRPPVLFDAFELRPIMLGDEPHFIAMEVGRALGYSEDGSRFARRLQAEWAGEFDSDSAPFMIAGADLAVLKGQLPTDSVGSRTRGMILLNEEGLYIALMLAGGPKANRFRKWLASEVLPSLRRTGSYSLAGAAPTIDAAPLAEMMREAVRSELRRYLGSSVAKPAEPTLRRALSDRAAADKMFDTFMAWALAEIGRKTTFAISIPGKSPFPPRACKGLMELDDHGRIRELYFAPSVIGMASRAHATHSHELARSWFEAGHLVRPDGWTIERLKSGLWSRHIPGIGSRTYYRVSAASQPRGFEFDVSSLTR
jgi:prophage antirepressor-like protein